MDLDDLLALAETRPSPLELARARRVARTVQSRYDLSLAEGYEIMVDTDLVDPVTWKVDEATRVARAAQLSKQGTLTWMAGGPGCLGRLFWSDEMAMIFGHAPGTRRLTPETVLDLVHPGDAERVRAAVRAAWERHRPDEVRFRVVQPGGRIRHVHCHLEILTAEDGPSGIIATGEDVTAFELARQERHRLAVRSRMLSTDLAVPDVLTGLPTRAYVIDEVDRARRSTGGALVVVATEPATRLPDALTDEDRDRVTAEVARVLRAVVGAKVTGGLVGSGSWGVLLTPADDHPETAESLAARIVETFRNHLFSVRQKPLRFTISAGVVHFGSGVPATGFDLLIDGENAARDARRNGTAVTVLDRPVEERERTERCRSRIHRVVSANRFALYAQPIVDLQLNQVTRHEILLRVRSDTGEPVAPWAFLDMAERVGEILTVDKWVVDHALELIGRGAQTSHYQVNISGRSLADPGLLAFVTDAIDRHRVKPDCLTFEITETALIENRNEAMAFATGIRELGCHLALDDFGTGYGTLTHLKQLPVDLVKIDGTFIVDLCRSPASQAVVSTLVELCHTLGIRVAAEYVQDEETIELLRNCGVDFAQGYRTGRPEPITVGRKEVQTVELELRFPPQHTALG
ncbi:EAL domain-containing protein [Micromonospora sp. WMMD1128]|uniref:EAL domain-containing protein n=1 Tax=unclassified Micromonospora TaxID=2617518 RepID=UPI00248B0A45|nr:MULTISPECIES: GGDEF domain-containing phosphodiesterase [unclassified Micromonospora]WBB73453.1 EAL domain-containing protein [Micromonospora sp. WMMD1128]WFE33154.1 EAL domain-containing protein [Micromonospora sp. WMMD975]